MAIYNFDLESFSECDLKTCGSYRYAQDPTTDVTCAAYWIDGTSEPALWRPGAPRPPFAPGDTIRGWNVCGFDAVLWRYILAPKYGWIDPGVLIFDDSMHRAALTNLPLSLAGCGAALLAGERKDDAGHRLMMRLCKPVKETTKENDPQRHHTPENIAKLEEYCRQDVRAEAELASRLPDIPPAEKATIRLDRTVNERGLRIHRERVAALQWLAGVHQQAMRERLQAVTGGAVESETKRKDLVTWLRTRGVAVPDGKGATNKDAVTGYLEDPELDGRAREALEIVQAIGLTSLGKLDAINRAICNGDRVRGTLQYSGATQTGRWIGRIVQWQNVARGFLKDQGEYDGALDMLHRAYARQDPRMIFAVYGGGDGEKDQVLALVSSLLRTVVIPAEGHVFLDTDWNAIEARIAAWLADEPALLDVFATGKDPYKLAYSRAMGVAYDQVTKDQRNKLGKPLALGAQYRLGAKRFVDYAAGYGAEITLAQAEAAIAGWREGFPKIPAAWKALEVAAKRAIRQPNRWHDVLTNGVAFGCKDGHLRLRLPSGRALWFRNARIVEVPAPWDANQMLEQVSYMCSDQNTKQWGRTTTHGGPFFEELVQATGRDLLAHAMHVCEERGMPVVLHVHDQILSEVPAARADLKAHEAAMCELPSWAKGLPIKAEGFVRNYWVK